jgi:hypothetical protein
MKTPKSPQYEFHKLDSCFIPATGRRGKGWRLEITSDWLQTAAIRSGNPLAPFGPALFANTDDPNRREDFPDISDLSFLIVSERARAVMEQEAPGNCQYLPIEVKHKGEVIDSTYSIVNCLQLLTCIDEELSARWNIESKGLPTRHFMRVEIDPSRVPQDVVIFRVVDHAGSIFIRERLRLALKKAKLTGWKAWQG